jgi:hypothetical protein
MLNGKTFSFVFILLLSISEQDHVSLADEVKDEEIRIKKTKQ